MSTSKLQQHAAKLFLQEFGSYGFRENSRPSWLISDKGERLELDIFLEHFGMAVEVQGEQHFGFIEHFHGNYESFLAQQSRDEAKRKLCLSNNVNLYEVTSQTELDDLISALRESLKSTPPSKDPKWWMRQQRLYVHGQIHSHVQRVEDYKRYLRQLELMVQKGEVSQRQFRLKRDRLESHRAKLRRAQAKAWAEAAQLPYNGSFA